MLSDDEFAAQFRGSPIRRAKNEGMKRNVCVALGNIGDERAVSGLSRALMEESALVRGHAAWALGRIGGHTAYEALQDALAQERDHDVIGEIKYALEEHED
jgi:epoxyqueuosine reductase